MIVWNRNSQIVVSRFTHEWAPQEQLESTQSCGSFKNAIKAGIYSLVHRPTSWEITSHSVRNPQSIMIEEVLGALGAHDNWSQGTSFIEHINVNLSYCSLTKRAGEELVFLLVFVYL